MQVARARSCLALLGRAVRWQPQSYALIWVICAAGYLGCAVVLPLVAGKPQDAAFTYVGMLAAWLGAGTGMSIRLHLRRGGRA